MKYCSQCLMPDTRPRVVFNAEGVCNACRSHASRPDIDWKSRAADFRGLVENVRKKGKGYDCVIPASGGKPRDSRTSMSGEPPCHWSSPRLRSS